MGNRCARRDAPGGRQILMFSLSDGRNRLLQESGVVFKPSFKTKELLYQPAQMSGWSTRLQRDSDMDAHRAERSALIKNNPVQRATKSSNKIQK